MAFIRISTGLGIAISSAAAMLMSIAPAYAHGNSDKADTRLAAKSADQFSSLFSQWAKQDNSPVPGLAAIGNAAQNQNNLSSSGKIVPARTSIPSRTPIDNYRLSSDYGMRIHPVLGGRRAHSGLDMAAPVGTPIYATADGVVSRAEYNSGGYGLLVALDHGDGLETRYAHMSRMNVSAGQNVRKGEVIGFVGATGRATGPHLHYEVRVAGQAVNPIPYMQAEDTTIRLASAR